MLKKSPLAVRVLGPLDIRDPFHTKGVVLPHGWGARLGEVDYIAPKGLVSDGASIPRIAWRFCPPLYDLHRPAAILHDTAYKGLLRARNSRNDWMPVERSEIDTAFYYLCLWNGMNPIKAWMLYITVSKAGWVAWNHQHKIYGNLDARKLDYTVPEEEPDFHTIDDMMSGRVKGYLKPAC